MAIPEFRLGRYAMRRDEAAKLFHLDLSALGSRAVPMWPVLDNEGKFHIWVPRPDGSIQFLQGTPVQSYYFARKPALESDLEMPFLNAMYQRLSWDNNVPLLESITNDLHNLAASVAKLDLYHEVGKTRENEVSRFVTTEIEYLVGVCRSVFDLLQGIAANLWKRIKLDKPKFKKMDLPHSFAAACLAGKKVSTAGEIEAKYGVPPNLARFYEQSAGFFMVLRDYRDEIHHGGLTPTDVYVTPRGFAVPASTEPFSAFGVWRRETFLPNELAPLRPVVAHLVSTTLSAMDRFVEALQSQITLPKEIAPGYRIFLRGYHAGHLRQIRTLFDKPWHE